MNWWHWCAVMVLVMAGMCGAQTLSTDAEGERDPTTWLRRAVEHAGQVEDAAARGQVHYELVYPLARAGDLTGARAAIERIDKPQHRIYAHSFVARQAHKAGDAAGCDAALGLAAKEALGWDSNFGHAHVIKVMLELGKAEAAIELASRIELAFHRNIAMREIAAGLAGRGEMAAAERVVKQRLAEEWRASARAMMAGACADGLRVEAVDELAGQLEAGNERDAVYVRLAVAMIKAGRMEEASAAGEKIGSEKIAAEVRGTIAAAVAGQQGESELRAGIEAVESREEKTALLEVLLQRQLDAGEIEKAEETIRTMVRIIDDSPRPAQVTKFGVFDVATARASAEARYLDVAERLAKQGDGAGARQRLERVRKAIVALPGGLARSMLAQRLLQAEIASGELEAARASLGQLDQDMMQGMLAGQLAKALVEAGDVKQGLEVADLIGEGVWRGSATAEVACELIRRNDIEAAQRLMGMLTEKDAREFRSIGRVLSESGRMEEVQRWLDGPISDARKAYLCLGAADALVYAQPKRADEGVKG